MQLDEDVYLSHYGILRRSGRYPYGSGGDKVTTKDNRDFLGMVSGLKKEGLTDGQIAQGFGMSIAQLRAAKTLARAENAALERAMINDMKYKKAMANTAIAAQLGISEAKVRDVLKETSDRNKAVIDIAVDSLRKSVEKHGMIDVGAGVEHSLNISKERLKVALELLKAEGYNVHSNVPAPQMGTGFDTKMRVLTKSDITWGDTVKNRDKIRLMREHLNDDGTGMLGMKDPLPLNPKRLAIRYKEDGGADADGVLYVRPGVKDLSLGGSRYAQVRIQVGDSHYIKGMAIYKDDLPDGIDIVFNTNKTREEAPNKLDALKELKRDPTTATKFDKDGKPDLSTAKIDRDNPFGAQIGRQILDPTGKKPTSVMNLVNEEGDWDSWSKGIASQVLSKQSPKLAKEQLDMTYERYANDLADVMKLTNPVIKKHLLDEVADRADKAAVHLKAASLPRQNWHVILPVKSLKENEVFAPKYKDGERVVLIRYPHGGLFEIPELTVNNRNREAIKTITRSAKDAVGIHPKTAERLSGADFDGDTVLVIPNNGKRILTKAALKDLEGFDPKTAYPGYPGMKTMTDTNQKMGRISNLITDMTIKGAPASEIARAVKHSMVVIDAEKHGLDYKSSYKKNGIPALEKKYQTNPETGRSGAASTLISRAKSPTYIPERRERRASEGGRIDKKTGEIVYVPTNRKHYKTGKLITVKEPLLKVTPDARTLSSGTRIENLYADHSNRLKALANRARLEQINTPPLKRSASAAKVYKDEVASLKGKLYEAELNAPLERRAQLIADATYQQKLKSYPDMDKSTRKKVRYQALAAARERVGAKKKQVEITPKEWEAIQAGAISNTMLEAVVRHADVDKLRELARPKTRVLMTPTATRRAQSMIAQGYTLAEVADHLKVSLSTLNEAL